MNRLLLSGSDWIRSEIFKYSSKDLLFGPVLYYIRATDFKILCRLCIVSTQWEGKERDSAWNWNKVLCRCYQNIGINRFEVAITAVKWLLSDKFTASLKSCLCGWENTQLRIRSSFTEVTVGAAQVVAAEHKGGSENHQRMAIAIPTAIPLPLHIKSWYSCI